MTLVETLVCLGIFAVVLALGYLGVAQSGNVVRHRAVAVFSAYADRLRGEMNE